MKNGIFSMAMVLMTMSVFGATALTYNGETLEFNNDFTRTECGKAYKDVMPEVSGMACSRTTPGYLWLEGDDSFSLVATKHDGTKAMEIELTGLIGRDDWEDLATGAYNGKNYIFLGAVGDNKLAYKDNYIIYYFEEPAITSGTKKIAAKYLKLGYPDGMAHNTEAIMYDNVENILYVVDKVYDGQCSVYYIPFNLDYGTGLQKLTYVCTLGKDGEYNFQTVTAADIAPSGKYIIIKNNIKSEDCEKVSKDAAYALIWERKDGESVQKAVKGQPKQIAAYELEKQGEAVAWLNDSIFYTTSDQKKDVAIYQYTRWNAKATEPGQGGEGDGEQGGGDDPIVTPTGDSTQCGTIIKAVYEVDSKTNATVTGTIGGTADVKLSESGKLDKSKYFGITLAAGHFHVGDVVTYTMSKAADLENTYMIVYADKDRNTIIYENKDILGGTTLSFTVSQMVKSIYLSRPDGAGWNPYISSVAVTRKCDQESTALKSVNTHSVATKFMHKGHLYLRRGQDIYTTQGQKM